MSVPVGRLFGDHPSDAAPGVFYVALVAGDEVDVGVVDCLSGSLVGVDPDVEPVRVEPFEE